MTHEEYRSKISLSEGQAHRELFEDYCGYVYAIVFNRLRSCASREDIEECVCDVFADVYIYYDTEKELKGDVSGFIGTIARRKAAELYKRCSVRSDTVPIDDEACEQISSGDDIEAEAEKKECRRIILDKIAELGEPDSTIIFQKYYYGRSAKEIAEMVRLTPENIRVRSGRAVKKLKEMLERAGISL
ncbi:MAG: sigma-70 family RNA polymerase sigma factor [Ruminococcus sp.]|nr:sigma-70 family RNA polymerase sigma factor [Ruminococcus sp.]